MLKDYLRQYKMSYLSNIVARIDAGTDESREFVKSLRVILIKAKWGVETSGHQRYEAGTL